jgi:hypothetical protein
MEINYHYCDLTWTRWPERRVSIPVGDEEFHVDSFCGSTSRPLTSVVHWTTEIIFLGLKGTGMKLGTLI